MKRKRFTEEHIGRIARAAEATTIDAATRQHRVSDQSFYPWQRRFGQLDVANVREARHLRQENTRPNKIIVKGDLEGKVMKKFQAGRQKGDRQRI